MNKLEIIKAILNKDNSGPTDTQREAGSALNNSLIGKYAIVRSRNEGINAGYIEAYDSTAIVLSQARRIWHHKPADKKLSWYEGVAVSGVSDDSNLSCPVVKKVIVEDYSITLCTPKAIESIEGAAIHAQK